MNKIILSIVFMVMLFSVVSCGNTISHSEADIATSLGEDENVVVNGGILDEEERVTYLMSNTDNIVIYEELISDERFAQTFSNFTDEANPLRLSGGTDPNAYTAKPFKLALISSEGYEGEINVLYFPVMSDEKCIGAVIVNCMDPNALHFAASEFIAPRINEELEEGSISVFLSASIEGNVYAINEDNRVTSLLGDTSYDELLSFSDVNKGYNLITTESLSESVYPIK